MNRIIVALALLATPAVARYDKTFEVNIKDTAVSSIEAANIEGSVETQITDQLAAGGEYQQNSAKFAPKSLFTRWTSKGGDPLAITATYNVASNSADVEVEYEKSGTTVTGNFDTDRKTLLTDLEVSRDFRVEGRDLTVAPSYDFAGKSASVAATLALSKDTTVELTLDSEDPSNRDTFDGTLTIDHAINAKNSIKPTFALSSGKVTYEYTRQLDGDAELTVEANPGKGVEIEWDDAGSKGLWTTNVKMPWGKPVGASVSFKRAFKL